MNKYKYYLKVFYEDEYKEVSQEQFVQAEKRAGFHPKPGCGPVATAGFSGGGLKGHIKYIREEE